MDEELAAADAAVRFSWHIWHTGGMPNEKYVAEWKHPNEAQ